jgi:hypothetical protein
MRRKCCTVSYDFSLFCHVLFADDDVSPTARDASTENARPSEVYHNTVNTLLTAMMLFFIGLSSASFCISTCG